KRVLKDGDIVGLDLGAIVDGFYGDSAVTVPVGAIPPGAVELLRVTEEALYKGIEQAIVGNRLSDISHAIQRHAEAAGFSVVTDFVGHGIGQQLHEEPQIPNYGKPGQGPRLQVGMVLAIEPMINMGGSAVRVLEDQWTAVTRDGSLSAHFEHTIAVQASGSPRILTKL
ncbi:MAG: type I methionyl aminopeptidase, partial [Nitrospiraceae bacterium]